MVSATALISGEASGPVLFSDTPLSFMMGVDAATGIVADIHQPLRGASLTGTVLAIPFGRGSCAGSGAILELLVSGTAPAALIFNKPEDILTLGVQIGKSMFNRSIPVILLEDTEAFNWLAKATFVQVKTNEPLVRGEVESHIPLSPADTSSVALTPSDQAMLNGGNGPAAQMAMEMILSYAALQGAKSLLSVSQVHTDACCYVGKSSLLVPERLHALGGKFTVPSTCNAVNVDRLRWQELGADLGLSRDSVRVGDLYLAMGAKMSFTILGARTQKYPDYLDVFIALTGRAPNAGCHLLEGRTPKVRVEVPPLDNPDSSIFPLLGHHVGSIVRSGIPIVYGLEGTNPTLSDLKAFSAGFAASSACPMFHIAGVTPEASLFADVEDRLERINIEASHLAETWKRLNTATDNSVDLVSLGNPHFGIEEFARLAELCRGGKKGDGVEMVITTSQDAYKKALGLGYLDALDEFGAQVMTDTCWCMVEEPVIAPRTRHIMTNSSKCAHYGPGLVNRGFHFGSLEACVDAACRRERSEGRLYPSLMYRN